MQKYKVVGGVLLAGFLLAGLWFAPPVARAEVDIADLLRQVQALQAQLQQLIQYATLSGGAAPVSVSPPSVSASSSAASLITLDELPGLPQVSCELSDLKFGDEKDTVYLLQTVLTRGNYYNGPITGYYGRLTSGGVAAFQRARGLRENGRNLDAQTRQALRTLIAQKFAECSVGVPTETPVVDQRPVVVVAPEEVSASIRVTAPGSGAHWQTGQTATIEWDRSTTSLTGKGRSKTPDFVSIFMSPPAPDCLNSRPACAVAQRMYTIASIAPNSGSYRWTIPADLALGGEQIISIRVYDNSNIFGESDLFFIDNPTLSVPAPVSARLNQKFVLQVGQTAVVRDYHDLRVKLKEVLIPSCAPPLTGETADCPLPSGSFEIIDSGGGAYSGVAFPVEVAAGSMVKVGHGEDTATLSLVSAGGNTATLAIVSSSPSPVSSTITIFSPGDSEALRENSKFVLRWSPINGDFDRYTLFIGNSKSPGSLSSLSPWSVDKNTTQQTLTVSSAKLKEFKMNIGDIDEGTLRKNFFFVVQAEKDNLTIPGKSSVLAVGKSGIVSILPETDSNYPYLRVLSPNGGEQWTAGTKQAAQWSRSSDSSLPNTYYFVYLKTTPNQILGATSYDGSYVPVIFRQPTLDFPNFSFQIPPNITPGSYYLELDYADSNGVPLASDTSDAPFSIVAGGGTANLPDLKIIDITISPTTIRGGQFFIPTYTIKNDSTVDVNTPFQVLSGGSGQTVFALRAGEVKKITGPQLGLSRPGYNKLTSRIDHTNAVAESDENNNEFSKEFFVLPTYEQEGRLTLKHWETVKLNNGLVLYADGANVYNKLPYQVKFLVYDGKANNAGVSDYPEIGFISATREGESFSFATSDGRRVVGKVNSITVGTVGNAVWSVDMSVSSPTGVPDVTPPSAPQNLTATSGDGVVTLSWSAPASNGGAAITGYNVIRRTPSTGDVNSTDLGNRTSYTVTGLTNGTVYYFKVLAVNSAGASPFSSEVSATPSGGVSPVVTTDSDNSPDYIATPPFDFLITPEKFPDLFIKGVGRGVYAGSSGNYIQGLEPNPSMPKPTADPYTTYYDYCSAPNLLNEAFRMSDGRLGAIGVSVPSSYICLDGKLVNSPPAPPAPPAAPTGISAQVVGTQINLNWTAPASNSSILRYRVVRSCLPACGSPVLIAEPATTNLGDNSTVAGTTYTYTVSAVNSSGEGPGSAPVTATAGSVAPTTGPVSCTNLQTTHKSFFDTCRIAGFQNACFNKTTGEFQGCITSATDAKDYCTTYNTNAAANLLCPVPVVTAFNTAQRAQTASVLETMRGLLESMQSLLGDR